MLSLRRWAAGTIVLAVLLLAWAVVPGLVYRQVLGYTATDIHDSATLPDRISMCGRRWYREDGARQITWATVQAESMEPIVADPRPFAPCPDGTCSFGPQHDACHTVIYVRVGEDAFLGYSLSGGP